MFSSQCPQSDHCQYVCYRKAITLKRKVVKLDRTTKSKNHTVFVKMSWEYYEIKATSQPAGVS